ncbi:hypothetical protein ALC53_03204 [Atta colombica]|uniref:Uncharacterized protein n=1 Tax=Atta colombica TaxID=520822 RepID=A0A151I5L5_9HYME|nr:hypothetical protein ALC53_03204 [Atta colombica]
MNFHCITNAAFDVMHDLYEGVCRCWNSIPPINEHHLKQDCLVMSSSEMSVLVTYFGIIIGDKISEDNPFWHFCAELYYNSNFSLWQNFLRSTDFAENSKPMYLANDAR